MKKLIKNLIPKSIKRKLLNHYTNVVKKLHIEKAERWEKAVPVFELEEKHLKNLKVVSNRMALLKKLPSNGVVAEIGVDEGNFSEQILKYNRPKKLHLVDLWHSERYHQGKRKGVEAKLNKEIASTQVEMNIGYSTEVVNHFQSNYFDWVYIDTSHAYKLTLEELKAYGEKMKEDGIMAGHDYIPGNWKGQVKYGVIEAVHEFCFKYDWEFLYLTMETRDHRSFAIRKIKG